MEFVIIHTLDSLDASNSVYNESKQFAKDWPELMQTESYKGDEHEYSYLFEERGDKIDQRKVYHTKFYGVLSKDRFKEYINKFSYMELETNTMGSLTDIGHLASVSLSYYPSSYDDTTYENSYVSPLVNSEWQYNKVVEWIEEQL